MRGRRHRAEHQERDDRDQQENTAATAHFIVGILLAFKILRELAHQLGDYDQVSGAITVHHDGRQVSTIGGGKKAIDAWIASRGDWPGALLCPVTKGGTVQRRPMGAPGRDDAGVRHRKAGGRRPG